MKKKIINGIMMVALVAATSTSFVSCKDTNEDVRVEMQQEYSDLLGKLKTLESTYGNLDGRVGDLETQVKNHAKSLETLQKEVDLLENWIVDAFSKLVYGVEISGTYNNMLGSINIPGFEPKMLIINWGEAGTTGSFPKSSLYEGEKIEWAMGKKLGINSDNDGFAGYIYANVNRYLDSTPMLSKAQGGDLFNITIANSAGEDIDGLFIGNVDEKGGPTTDYLNWGWTRADNNIYKFAVGYQGEDTKTFTPAKIDLAKFKADLKQVWADRNRSTGTSKQALGKLVADLYYNLATKDYNMKKYMLKFTWEDGNAKTESKADDDYTADVTDKDGNVIKEDASKKEATGLKHIATSEAELVFATIKPLGFGSGDVLIKGTDKITNTSINLINKMEPYIDRILNRVKKQIKLDKLNLPADAFDDAYLDVTDGKYYLTIPKASLTAKMPGAVITGDVKVDITDMIKPINESFGNVNDFVADMKKLMGKVSGKNIGDWMEKFITKANNLFNKNANQMLQPVLLKIDKDGNVSRVSGLKESPDIVEGEIRLEPTTYTAELFAPAYAKFLGCKNIPEGTDGFNTIIRANDKEITFTPKSGETYEIVYEAVDYFGEVQSQTYYIQGK